MGIFVMWCSGLTVDSWQAGDKEGIMALLTNAKVEELVIKRVQKKATAYGQEITDDSALIGPAVPDENLNNFKVLSPPPDIPSPIYPTFSSDG